MVLKYNNEEEVIFFLFISEDLSQINFYTLDFVVGLNSLSEVISVLFANCWTTYAKRIMITTWSKKWWNNDYKMALETYK